MYILIVLVLFLYIVILYQLNKKDHFNNPCTDYLSNKDYLVHMIPHHQVAIDMCNLMIPLSKSKTIQHIYRNIIFNQKIEIMLMNQVLKNIPNISNNYDIIFRDNKFLTSISNIKKSKPENYYCDPLFFKPDDHSDHMNHMKHTDKSFLEHMIPHHQVAIVMSERLLKHTNNTHMIRLCYDIITAQRGEILQMNYILDYLNKHKIEFLPIYY